LINQQNLNYLDKDTFTILADLHLFLLKFEMILKFPSII